MDFAARRHDAPAGPTASFEAALRDAAGDARSVLDIGPVAGPIETRLQLLGLAGACDAPPLRQALDRFDVARLGRLTNRHIVTGRKRAR